MCVRLANGRTLSFLTLHVSSILESLSLLVHGYRRREILLVDIPSCVKYLDCRLREGFPLSACCYRSSSVRVDGTAIRVIRV